jgi:hypothetical protein
VIHPSWNPKDFGFFFLLLKKGLIIMGDLSLLKFKNWSIFMDDLPLFKFQKEFQQAFILS